MAGEPDVLYHYTSAEGLIGIVKSKQIWATRAQYLNDWKEIAHAYDVVKELLPEVRHRYPEGTDRFRRYIDETTIMPWQFLASWTENGDDLSQWRAYGSNGPSYSVGFKREDLSAAAGRQGWRLVRCVYDPDEQKRVLREALNEFYERRESGQPANTKNLIPAVVGADEAELFTGQLFGMLLDVAPIMKHPAFESEREWRLISPVTDELPMAHRAGTSSIIPHTGFELPMSEANELAVADTYVGPSSMHDRHAQDAVFSLYRAEKVVGSGTRMSTVPYRNW